MQRTQRVRGKMQGLESVEIVASPSEPTERSYHCRYLQDRLDLVSLMLAERTALGRVWVACLAE